ncbi:MAG: stage V sporulation protein T [Eubacteriales bacterium]|nr:stage V sporulation protein T [Eubacteriales bacterium]
MKATGIVRRIDELGRVVIPKEIRRTLRIRESDPLEIFTDREGEIILKKYSPIGELGDFANEYTAAMQLSLGHIAAICDKDVFISVSGGAKRDLLEKPIHEDIERVMANREKIRRNASSGEHLLHITADEDGAGRYPAQMIVPILSEGDAIGAVVLLSKDQNAVMGDPEWKVAETAAGFIGKQMEQ